MSRTASTTTFGVVTSGRPPGGRWMIVGNLYANDELRKLFSRKHRSFLPFGAAIEELGSIVGRAWGSFVEQISVSCCKVINCVFLSRS